ncbi:MAG TPA: mechanosensitive ion channel family protein, partial [Polyangiaceae bacterium]|nr:mechanosensitive ion channel family protein [Polyangiaceae bacterium]
MPPRWYRGPALAVLDWLEKLPTWSLVVAYAAFWSLVALLVGAGLRRSLAGIARHRRDELSDVLARSLPRPAGAAVLLVALAGGVRFLPFGPQRIVEAHRFIAVALCVLGVVVLMRVALRSIEAYGRSNPQLKSSAGIGKAITWVVGLAVVAALVSDALGVSLAPALTALGVGSLAVALALQDTLSNFFSGVYLVVDKPVRPGDFIRVDPTFEGYVESIGWRSTHLRTLANNLVILPNAVLSKSVITNYSLPTANIASSVRVDVAFGVDLDRVEDALADEAKRALDLPGMADVPAPSVTMSPGFVDGAVGFTVAFHVRSFADQSVVQPALRKRI